VTLPRKHSIFHALFYPFCVPKCEVQGIGWRSRTHLDGVPSMSYAEARNGGD
jgi:hypothetical protein